MSQLASALVLNIGTLTSELIESMKLAARAANQKGIPVVLDVCGAGATPLRDRKCVELLEEASINIIKGNASEIARISGASVRTRGVDATEVDADLVELGERLAKERRATVVITGKVDLATDGEVSYRVANGHSMMTSIVGTGCMASSVIGTFAAVEPNLTLAAAGALAVYGIAGELAAADAAGPATFKERLFDCLYNLDRATVEKMQRVEQR